MFRNLLNYSIVSMFVLGLANRGLSEPPAPSKPKVLTRLIWQDDDARLLRTADLLAGNMPQLGPVTTIAGFPQLDPERQTLVQMDIAHGFILLGVRDDDNGQFQSGWVLVDAGVEEEEHGDHSHWVYSRSPRVCASVLDDKQGNPAHLYCYDSMFFIANDRLNGFTWFDPKGLAPDSSSEVIRGKAAFHQGGGGHITLAAVDRRVVYSCWIDREGPNQGRVDVTLLQPEGNTQISQTVKLPYGGIHGATSNGGKVFFAPVDGICWMDANASSSSQAIHHLSLGKEGDRPVRTGAFTNYERYVAFLTGRGDTAALQFLDATQPTPKAIRLPLKLADGNRPTGLEFVKPRRGSPLAFVFHDHGPETEAPNRLSIIEMDPNQDQNWQDAKVVQELDVGSTKVEGHGGHHCVAFDGDRRRAIFTNSGDGTLVVLSLDDRKVLGKFTVGGAPSKLIAIGGRGSDH
jgi:hypothetical protein